MDYLIDKGWYNYGGEVEYSDVETSQVSEHTGISMEKLRGVLSSLIKKNMIWIAHYNWEHGHDSDEYHKEGMNIVYSNRNAYSLRGDLEVWDEYINGTCLVCHKNKANEYFPNPKYIKPGPQYTVKFNAETKQFSGVYRHLRKGRRPDLDTHFTHRLMCDRCSQGETEHEKRLCKIRSGDCPIG